ncbi:MAG: hypothetical protein RLO17_07640 [Cyclobacteriaceae bacterium]
MSSLELNIKFYDALNDIFKINKHRTWAELSKEITIENISETYKVYADIFHSKLNRYSLLPKNKPTEKLTSIFHGTLDGQTIINNVARYSLYCDEIIVFHPLQNPNITHPKYNPITTPEQWKLEFVNALYFYIVLQKWVRAGLVHLIENPFYFDKESREELLKQAETRVSALEKVFQDPELMAEHEEMMFEKFKRSLLGMPLDVIKKTIEGAYPRYSKEQIHNLALELKQYEKTLPLYVDFGDSSPGNLMVNRAGGNVEMVDAICKLTGAHSYTTQKFVKRQLELRGTNPFWTKFSSLYSGIDLTYLDSVDTSFALKMREEERISGLRNSLRSLSSFLETSELDKVSEDKILDFNDSIKQEVKRSEEEWMKIINDAKKANATAVFGSSVIGAIIDPTKILVPAIGIPSSAAIVEIFKRKGLKSYRAKDPYSVFVDLKNKKPSFVSELKNCIF